MKTLKVIYYILMFLPLPITLISLFFLPDQIPAHFGSDNQVTRWGSKYEVLIYPIITIIFGFIMLVTIEYSEKKKIGKHGKKTSILLVIFSLVFFNLLTVYFLYVDFNSLTELPAIKMNHQVIFALLGIFLIIIGCILPKVRMNSVIGIRTRWSMKNENTWKKCQHFGGITSMIAGCIILFIGVFTKAPLVYSVAVLTGTILMNICYSYKIARKD